MINSASVPNALPAIRESAPRFHLGYRPWLDGLRGLAIVAVMAYHYAPRFLPHGYIGVDLFFVISGCLITTLLLEEWQATQKINFRHFYLRRMLRLFPALAVMLLASLILMYLFPYVGQQYRSVLYAAFYAINWFMAFNPDAVSSLLHITWSLSIEEQFYIVWPITLYCLLRCRVRPMMLLGILIALLTAVCIHKTVLISHGAPVIRVAHGSDTRIDGLIIGCCVGVLASSGMVSRIARWVSASLGPLLLVFVTYMMGIIAPYGFGLTIVNLFFAALLIVLLATGPTTSVLAGFLSARPLLWLGKLSYSLYLWHIIARLAARSLFKDAGLVFLCSITLALLMAAISYYLIERPFLKLKKRFHEPMKTISTD